MMARLGIYSSIGNDYLGNKSGVVRPSGPTRECHNVPMDPQDLDYHLSPPSFAPAAFVCKKETEW